MRSLSFNGPDHVELVDVPLPEPGEGEVLVRIEASAICGSELHAGDLRNPGHEAAGVVEHAPNGSGYEPGDRVGLSAVSGCETCEHCRSGIQLYCSQGPRVQVGMHAEYAAVPVSALRRMPEGVPPEHAVLISGDTLGVPVRAHRRLPSRAGERVLIVGLGPIGLGHTLVRAHAGAEVVAVEPSEFRRQLALKLGAAEVLTPGVDIGAPPSLVIECTGLPECIRFAFETVDAGGTVLQSGECSSVEMCPSETVIRREITYTGTWYYAEKDFPEMVRLYEEGLPVADMLTDELPADQIGEAYQRFVSKESGKVVLRWS